MPAASHPHLPLPGRGFHPPTVKTVTGLTTKCHVHVSPLPFFWGPLFMERGQGEGADINSVCAGVQPGFALCSKDQG